MQAEATARCRGPGCGSHELIRAHIMPAGFARAMHSEGGYNLGISETGARRARLQHGAFDGGILCGGCDRRLGVLDEFALGFCMDARPPAVEGRIGVILGVDVDRFAAFVTSVVWRASASTLPAFATIELGPLNDVARAIAFGDAPPSLPVIANRLVSSRHDVRGFYVQPHRRRVDGINAYTLLIGGFQLFLLADTRPVPRKFEALAINGRGELPSLGVPLEGTTEYRGMRKIADRVRLRLGRN